MFVDRPILYVGSLTVEGNGRGFSESYNLLADDPDAAAAEFGYFCEWRAAILALGLKLTYAKISQKGGSRDSRIAITTPRMGLQGVYVQNSKDFENKVNTISNGILVRTETQFGKWATRIVRGLPDWTINNQDYFLGDTQTTLLNLWDTPTLMGPTDFPKAEVWPYSSTPTAPATGTGTGNPLNVGWVAYNDAIRFFFQALASVTCYAKFISALLPNVADPTNPLPGYRLVSWKKGALRRAADRTAGLPSGR